LKTVTFVSGRIKTGIEPGIIAGAYSSAAAKVLFHMPGVLSRVSIIIYMEIKKP
jgi:hypothetical protein